MWRTIKDILFLLFVTVLFATGLKSCIVDAYKIPSGSMIPTLTDGDFLLVNKFIYGARTPHHILFIPVPSFRFPALHDIRRGHVIVFEFPGEPNESIVVRNLFLVKRCAALPGDTVSITNGAVMVNRMKSDYFPAVKKDMEEIVVPKQGMIIPVNAKNFLQLKVFIQREGSEILLRDGRIVIDGNVVSYYTVRRNYYFMLGDNINNSSDSRDWGFVPEDQIVGKAMMIYWSKNNDGVRWERMGTIVR